MILSKYFVFIHLSKTGGSFVRTVCREHAPADWQLQIIDGHPTIFDIPLKYQSLPKLGLIRNPYSWYVSAYSYLKKRGNNQVFNELSEKGTKDFKNTLKAVLDLRMSFVDSKGLGGYTWHIKQMFGDDLPAMQIGKFEELRHDLLRIMNSAVTLPESLVKAIHTYPAVNVSEHDHYRSYYDDELRELIAQKDRWIFEAFGYNF